MCARAPQVRPSLTKTHEVLDNRRVGAADQGLYLARQGARVRADRGDDLHRDQRGGGRGRGRTPPSASTAPSTVGRRENRAVRAPPQLVQQVEAGLRVLL